MHQNNKISYTAFTHQFMVAIRAARSILNIHERTAKALEAKQ